MKKYILFLSVIAFFLTSCDCEDSSKESKDSNNKVAVADEVTTINMADFDAKVGDNVGKKIRIKGTVDHVCSHGGQKLFLVSEDADTRVKITPDEEIAAFNSDMEGDKIVLIGVVEEKRIDEAFLKEWEEEVNAAIETAKKESGKHGSGETDEGCEYSDELGELDKINALRNDIKESGTDHLSFYSVLCTSYDVVNDNPAPATHDHGDGEHSH